MWPGEKVYEIKGGGQEMAVMVQVDDINFNNNNSGDLVPIPAEAGMR